MSEQPIVWMGRKPASQAPAKNPAQDEAFAGGIREACAGCGYEVEDFVAAMGDFGGWLVQLSRGGTRYRAFWDGKARRLVLEANRPGGWTGLRQSDADGSRLDSACPALIALLTPGETSQA